MLRRTAALFLLLFLSLDITTAQPSEDSGGVQFVRGTAPYTFPYFRMFLPQPYIILYDAYGVIAKDMDFMPSEESQIIGAITSDPFTSPFTYELSLPFAGRGRPIDVDNDGEDDLGVQVFLISLTSNTWNSPFLEQRDDFVTGILNSAVISSDIDSFLQFQYGTLAVYAEEAGQGFPTGKGADGILFTDDDPSAPIPVGWSLIDISTEPFTVTRDEAVDLTLLEAEEAELTDFSDFTYVEAFDRLIDHLKREYSFTEYKNIDWEARRQMFRPRIEEAQANRSATSFRRALRDLAWSIPDGHVSGPHIAEDFQRDVSGGLGMVLRELDDGGVIVSYVSPGGPADRAGITPRAKILSLDGEPIADALMRTIPYTSPFSTPHNLRLEQLRFVHRRPIGTSVKLNYRAPDGAELTVSVDTELDSDSFFAASLNAPLQGTELPVEFRMHESGLAIISIYSFSDDLPLTVDLWERAIQTVLFNDIPGIILDIRQNGGGSGFLGDQLPAYFFDQAYVIGNTAEFSESRGEFVINPLLEDRFILPPPELRYSGPVAVLISPDCASACESFAWAMTIEDRAAIVGHYPTAGLGGSVVPVAMPDGAIFNYTQSRAVDANGEISIEGIGVTPTVRVPVTEETIFSERDVLMDAAVEYLLGRSLLPAPNAPEGDEPAGEISEGGDIMVGQTVTGTLAAGSAVRYNLAATASLTLDIVASGEGDLARGLVVRLYLPNDNRALDESYSLIPGEPGAGFLNMNIPVDMPLVIEIQAVNPNLSGGFTLSVTESP
jgi:C-terminal processing protease CtpA/Prc